MNRLLPQLPARSFRGLFTCLAFLILSVLSLPLHAARGPSPKGCRDFVAEVAKARVSDSSIEGKVAQASSGLYDPLSKEIAKLYLVGIRNGNIRNVRWDPMAALQDVNLRTFFLEELAQLLQESSMGRNRLHLVFREWQQIHNLLGGDSHPKWIGDHLPHRQIAAFVQNLVLAKAFERQRPSLPSGVRPRPFTSDTASEILPAVRLDIILSYFGDLGQFNTAYIAYANQRLGFRERRPGYYLLTLEDIIARSFSDADRERAAQGGAYIYEGLTKQPRSRIVYYRFGSFDEFHFWRELYWVKKLRGKREQTLQTDLSQDELIERVTLVLNRTSFERRRALTSDDLRAAKISPEAVRAHYRHLKWFNLDLEYRKLLPRGAALAWWNREVSETRVEKWMKQEWTLALVRSQLEAARIGSDRFPLVELAYESPHDLSEPHFQYVMSQYENIRSLFGSLGDFFKQVNQVREELSLPLWYLSASVQNWNQEIVAQIASYLVMQHEKAGGVFNGFQNVNPDEPFYMDPSSEWMNGFSFSSVADLTREVRRRLREMKETP